MPFADSIRARMKIRIGPRMHLTSTRLFSPFCRRLSRDLAIDLMVCLRFYSRVPLPRLSFEPESWDAAAFGRAVRVAPIAGALIGMVGSVSLGLFGLLLGLPSWIAAAVAVAGMIGVSGALHEDGLADVADGFGGGRDRQRKLDIMRDSRIGTFGAVALILVLLIRVGALAALIDRFGYAGGIAASIGGGAASRGFGLWPLATLPPARADGLAHAAGVVPRRVFLCALGLATLLGALPLMVAGLGMGRSLLACAAAFAASITVAHLARRQIGGQTGDVAGAAQQLAEIGFLLALLVAPRLG